MAQDASLGDVSRDEPFSSVWILKPRHLSFPMQDGGSVLEPRRQNVGRP
jgi:hypothetical protein